MAIYILLGLLYPFAGTFLGSLFVFFLKKEQPEKILLVALDSLAAGIMCAASFFSLISPACKTAETKGLFALILCGIGFFCGIFVFVLTDKMLNKTIDENRDKSGKLLMWAVTIHNIPEGMAVGIALAGFFLSSDKTLSAGALSLSVGIALQNIPEGAIISLPLKAKGKSRTKAFLSGIYSGIAELVAGIVTLFLSSFVYNILPFFMCFAAGAMFFVVLKELSADFSDEKYGAKALMVFATGFTAMMLLDILTG